MYRTLTTAFFSAAAVLVTLWATSGFSVGQTQSTMLSKTADGKPDLNGIWQANSEAYWDLEPHIAQQGPWQFGALFSVPGGIGVVEGGKIPYLPEALEKKRQNFERRWTDDPEIKCYFPGVPRATYMPYPFQIVQTPTSLLFAYEYASASRVVPVAAKTDPPVDSWMGWSAGRWDGDSLVIEVTGFNEDTWFDRAGNFHSDALSVVERYTMRSSDVIQYEATIQDPKVFSRAWKISLPLYRRLEPAAQLVEFKCVTFTEELLYGHLRKQPRR
jgi:hypothetical protein